MTRKWTNFNEIDLKMETLFRLLFAFRSFKVRSKEIENRLLIENL